MNGEPDIVTRLGADPGVHDVSQLPTADGSAEGFASSLSSPLASEQASEQAVELPGFGSLLSELPGASDGNESSSAPTSPPPTEVVPEHDLTGALEAVLLVVDAPVTEAALATAVGHRTARIRDLLLEMAAGYTAASSGIELRELGGGWRFYTRDRFAPVVERFVLDGAQGRLSRAALETLAVIAYRQPVTRARVAGVRGVNVDGVVRTLMSRGLIEDVGADQDTGGLLYRTTDLFLERLGLSDLSELPSLGPLLPDIEGIDDV